MCNFKILVGTLKLYRLFISHECVVKISAIHNFTTTNVNIMMTLTGGLLLSLGSILGNQELNYTA